ncbi:MAG: T9SS type A sorting domain-containing protein [Flavobacteriales bacterium]|nr:T9SS type A sorting domain-containing protein [Flavobacteriales bacterium]
MKTTILTLFFTIASMFAFGQIVTTVNGGVHDPSTTYAFTSDTGTISVNVNITAASADVSNLKIRRVILNTIPSWKDDVCWGVGVNGQCYFGVQGTNPFTTPNAVSVTDSTTALLLLKISPKDPDYGCGEYRYYIEQAGTVLDSVSITVCKTLDVEELVPLTISLAPNPANDFFKVTTNNVKDATIKMVDVLGNVVLKETALGISKTIETTHLRNGIYFVSVQAEGQRPINRKVIVRH